MYSNIAYDYLSFFETQISNFGGVSRGNKKYVFRKNVNPFPDKGAYFGCIREGEDYSSFYSDLSIVVFPSNEPNDADDKWIIALGVGSLGYKNDYDLASLPGTRRLFMKYLGRDAFIKNDFMDIESHDGFSDFCNKNKIPPTLANAVENYKKVLLVATIFAPNNINEGEALIKKYLAIYAVIRGWPSKGKMKDVNKALSLTTPAIDDESKVKALLGKRKYVVLQGAPGTGKTRLAKLIPTKDDIVFFTQFHAETTYSDFVYGIIPDIKGDTLKYSERKGKFVEAINEAKKPGNENKKVYLIIDEINRANLSNVLGPAFYLFEPTMTSHNVKIEVCPGLELDKLPENLYVIATMNTADRSLAVVDFALRRRFAWYTIFPHEISQVDAGKYFCKDEFNAIADIFERYASDEELNLQPGHAYFVVPDDDQGEIKNRLRYEVMPLIKEYLLDGMLARAKDDFVNYFRREIEEEMFK